MRDIYGWKLKQYDIVLFKVGKFDVYNTTKSSDWIGIVLNNDCPKMGKSKILISNLIDPDCCFEPSEIGDIIHVGELEDLKYWLDLWKGRSLIFKSRNSIKI